MPVFPVHRDQAPYYPLVPAYCSTVHKVMGQTLQHLTLVFDSRYLTPAVGYAALSRVSDNDNVVPMLRLRKTHFINSNFFIKQHKISLVFSYNLFPSYTFNNC